MIVVSDTSPLNYLVLIGQDHILPALFGRVITPAVVLTEMLNPKAPPTVQTWASSPPRWLEIKSPTAPFQGGNLDPGEAAAIAIAQELNADALLIDERNGTKVAQRLGLFVAGTLAVIEMAAQRELLSLPETIAALRQTTFRAPNELIDDLLIAEQRRRTQKPPQDS